MPWKCENNMNLELNSHSSTNSKPEQIFVENEVSLFKNSNHRGKHLKDELVTSLTPFISL